MFAIARILSIVTLTGIKKEKRIPKSNAQAVHSYQKTVHKIALPYKLDTHEVHKLDTYVVHKLDTHEVHKLDTHVVHKLDTHVVHKLDTHVVQMLDTHEVHLQQKTVKTTPLFIEEDL